MLLHATVLLFLEIFLDSFVYESEGPKGSLNKRGRGTMGGGEENGDPKEDVHAAKVTTHHNL